MAKIYGGVGAIPSIDKTEKVWVPMIQKFIEKDEGYFANYTY